jgi:D-3-phosphoglycerate dehydrogenase
MPKVVILDTVYSSYEEEKSVFEPMGVDLIISKASEEAEITGICGDANGICLNLGTFSASVINSLENCRIISRYGVGYDNVDVDAATAKGIWVANVTDYCGEDVSDQAMGLFLSCVRKIARRNIEVRNGKWAVNTDDPIYRIKGKTFGFLGFGMIARIVCRKLKGFELGSILAADPFIDDSVVREHGAEPAEFDTVLKEADFISIHMPLNEKTRHSIGSREFELMKETAIIINTSRGPVIDEQALIHALKTGQINSAGIDVFEQEPVSRDNELLNIDKVTLSDHNGWYSEESMSELKLKTAYNVKSVLEGGKPGYPVNQIS